MIQSDSQCHTNSNSEEFYSRQDAEVAKVISVIYFIKTYRFLCVLCASAVKLLLHYLEAVHIRPQRIRDDDTAIGLLVVFQYCDQCTSDGKAGTVQVKGSATP